MTMHDDALEPTPQSYGFPEHPTRWNQQCWDRQEAFLAAYRHTSRITHAAKASGIPVHTVHSWIGNDPYSFKKRMELARLEYCDSVRQIIHDRLADPQGNRGSDILLMFEAKAMMPELYREEVKVMNIEAPLKMIEKLAELAKKERAERGALEEGQVVEGEIREIGNK
jgi:hypothetical protein